MIADGFAGTPPAVWETGWVGPDGVLDGDTWYVAELHRIAADLSELYVDGTLLFTGAAPNATQGRFLRAGQDAGNGLTPALVYHSYVKAGTSRGAGDVFADDFVSGDFSAWTTVVGDVTLVDTP